MCASMAGGGCGVLRQQLADARRAVEQLATAIGAAFIERVGAIGAEGILQRADERAALISGQINAAAFAIGAHLEHVEEIAWRRCGGKWRPPITPAWYARRSTSVFRHQGVGITFARKVLTWLRYAASVRPQMSA